MSESISVEGKDYISSKRASELSGYSQDYIGQLARGKHIDAQRVGGLWYVSMESLLNYKVTAEAYKPEPPIRKQVADPDSLISFDGKDYVSAARASKITGYHQDYVGQLARSATVLSRQVGNRWYVERDGIMRHKKEKDALLAAVQAEAVGLVRREASKQPQEARSVPDVNADDYFTYTNDSGDLMPIMRISDAPVFEKKNDVEVSAGNKIATAVPIRVIARTPSARRYPASRSNASEPAVSVGRIHGKTMSYKTIGAMAFTIVIVLMAGFSSFGSVSKYGANFGSQMENLGSPRSYTASASQAFGRLGDLLETLIVPELIYRRAQ